VELADGEADEGALGEDDFLCDVHLGWIDKANIRRTNET
jgi:hypothetical protein